MLSSSPDGGVGLDQLLACMQLPAYMCACARACGAGQGGERRRRGRAVPRRTHRRPCHHPLRTGRRAMDGCRGLRTSSIGGSCACLPAHSPCPGNVCNVVPALAGRRSTRWTSTSRLRSASAWTSSVAGRRQAGGWSFRGKERPIAQSTAQHSTSAGWMRHACTARCMSARAGCCCICPAGSHAAMQPSNGLVAPC